MSLRDRLTELVSFDTQNPSGRRTSAVRQARRRAARAGRRASGRRRRHLGGHARTSTRASARPRRACCSTRTSTPCRPTAATPRRRTRWPRSERRPPVRPRLRRHQGRDRRHPRRAGARPAAATVGVLFSGDEERGGSLHARLSRQRARARHRARHRLRADRLPRRLAPSRHRRRDGHADGRRAATRRAPTACATRSRCWRAPRSRSTTSGDAHREQGPAGLPGHLPQRRRARRRRRVQRGPDARARSSLSLRPAPGTDVGELLAEAEPRARAAVAPSDRVEVREANPPFATRDIAAFAPLLGARAREPIDWLLDRGRAAVRARHRRRRLRPRRHRAGARRRRVRDHRRAGGGAGRVRAGAGSEAMMEVEIIQRFLESVGQKADVDLYLKLFRAQKKESFAIICGRRAHREERAGPVSLRSAHPDRSRPDSGRAAGPVRARARPTAGASACKSGCSRTRCRARS